MEGENNVLFLCSQAYEELFWRRHIKCVRQVKRDKYDALRSVLFQIFSQGLSFPSWMKEKDIVKVCPHTGNMQSVALTMTVTQWAAEGEGALRGPVLCLSGQFAKQPSQKDGHTQFCLLLMPLSFLEKSICPLQ